MSTTVQGGNSTAGYQNVDENFNAQVNLPYTLPNGTDQGGGNEAAGFATMLSERDAGAITGVREVIPPEVTTNYRLRAALDQTMLNEQFPGAALNSSIWTAPVTTSTVSVGGGLLTLNNGSSLAANAVARVTTYRSFPVLFTYPLYVSKTVQFTAAPVANMVHEWGACISTGTSATTDGCYFTINASGQFRCVVNTNGVISQSDPLDFNEWIGINVAHYFLIYIGTDNVTFWVDNRIAYQSTLTNVAALGIQVNSGELPITFRSYNVALVTGTAQLMKVSAVNVTLAEMANSKHWSHIQAGAGKLLYQGQTGQTLGTLALYSNSLAAGAGAAMTNTTAALGTGLGGQFSALPTLTVGTDGILQSYQVPVGSATAPGLTLYITGVKIKGVVTTVLAGNTSPVVYAYSLAYGHNNVSLATTTTATSKAPVRVPLDIETYAAAAAVGTVGQGVTVNFDNGPIVVYPGEFIQTVAKNLGSVTTTGVITFLVEFTGYWE